MIASISDLIIKIYFQPLFQLHVIIFWGVSIICLLKDIWTFSVASENTAKYVNPSNRAIDWSLYYRAIGHVIYVQICLLAPLMWLVHSFYKTESTVSILSSLRTFALCGLTEEILFYYSHRVLHWPSMWKYHKMHHELVTPVAVAAIYASTVENVFVNILPVLLSPLLVGMSIELLWYWTVISTLIPVLSHSGFKCLRLVSEFHALHHLRKSGRWGNFGVCGLLDRLHGTYIVNHEIPL